MVKVKRQLYNKCPLCWKATTLATWKQHQTELFTVKQISSTCHATVHLYSVQPKVLIRVDGATELGTKISQSEAAAANVRVMPELVGTQV